MLVQLNDILNLLFDMVCPNAAYEVSQDNIRAFVDLIKGPKEEKCNAVKVKKKEIVIPEP